MTNASLDPVEPDAHVDALVGAVTAAKSAKLERHPEPDELVDYYLDALPPAQMEPIQDHLALCQECAQLVLDLQAITAPPQAGEGRPTPELNREWKRFTARLERRDAALPRRSRWTRTAPWALAASLLIGAGLLVWGLDLRRGARQPHADLALVDLSPATRGVERSEERPVQLRVPPGVTKLVLLLNLGDLRSFPRYDMQLLAPGSRVVWRTAAARRGEDGTFLVEVPRDILAAPGLYHVLLEGRRDREEVRLADYPFVVIQSEAASP